MTPQFNCRLRKTTQDAITANAKKSGKTIDEYLTRLVEIEMNPMLVVEEIIKGPAFGMVKTEDLVAAPIPSMVIKTPKQAKKLVETKVDTTWATRAPLFKPNGKL